MARDDWRLRIELAEEHAGGLLQQLGRVHSDADELADELRESRLAVTRDDGTVFVYTSSSLELERAQAVVERELAALGAEPRALTAEHWLQEEERWDDEAPSDVDGEILAEGYAPWEVRVPCADHQAAQVLARRLDAEGYGVVRRWTYVIAGCGSEAQARELARRLHGEVGPGGELVWESLRGHPFALVGPV
jgi:hypothetical protein